MIHYFLSILSLFCLVFSIQADLVGSNTLVSAESNKQFPENPGLFDNEIRGFAWMKNGFSLENSATDCIFNALFPVSGTVNLNGGTLTLFQNLIFSDITSLQGLGSIVGNGYTIEFCKSINAFPINTDSFDTVFLCCKSNMTLSSPVTFKGECRLCGNSNNLELADSAAIIVDSNSCLHLENFKIIGLKDSNIRCVDGSASLILENVDLRLTDSFVWSNGSILFKDDAIICGGQKFIFDSLATSTVDVHSQLSVVENVEMYLGRKAPEYRDPICMTDHTSVLNLHSCSFVATDSGIVLKNGTISLDARVTLDAVGTTTTEGIIVGSGQADEDVTIHIEPGAALHHKSGYWVYNNASPYKLKSSSRTARLIRDLESKIYAPKSFQVDDLTVHLISQLVAPLEVESGVSVSYQNAGVKLPDIELDMTASQLNYYTYMLAYGGSIFLTKGTLPMYLLVVGPGNQLHGNGGVTGGIIFQTSDTNLTCGLNGYINNSITLSNGNFILGNDLWIFEDGGFVGPGLVSLNKSQLIYKQAFNATTPLAFSGDMGTIVLNENISLSSTWTIQGDCKILGNGSTIDIKDNGALFVDTDSNLFLKNIRITGLSDSNISCSDASSSIKCENIEFILDGNYSFSSGSMSFASDNFISGGYTLFYDSSQTSTILSDSRLVLWDGLTFNIGRTDGNEPMAFESSTASLKLDDVTFAVRNTGMQVTKGKIVTARNVIVDVDSTSTANGLVFGDSTPENDMELSLSAATTTRFVRGHLTYDITSNMGIVSKSQTAQMVRYADSVFYLKHDLQLTDLTIDVSPYAQLIVDPGVQLTYSKGRIKNGQDEFEITAQWYNPYTMLMAGSGIANLVNGKMPLYLLVSGINNQIDGVGNISGAIIMSDPTARISCNFNGQLSNSITLNNAEVDINHDLTLTNDVQIVGPGTVDLNSHSLILGENDLSWGTDIHWKGNSAVINLRSNVSLNSTWTFEGSCIIKGNNHELQMGTGAIEILPNSRLVLQNVRLENVQGFNISCLDDTGVLVLSQVDWGQRTLDDPDQNLNFYFDKGAMRFKGKVTMQGTGIFAYETDMTSTILAQSLLKFDNGMTFSYYPAFGSANLIEMESDSSFLACNSASLVLSTTGMHLKKGQFMVKGDTLISADGYSYTDEDNNEIKVGNGLKLGGDQVADDCKLNIAAGARLVIYQGLLEYANQKSSSAIFENSISQIIFYPFTTLKLNKSLDLMQGKMIIDRWARIDRSAGATIAGSVSVERV